MTATFSPALVMWRNQHDSPRTGPGVVAVGAGLGWRFGRVGEGWTGRWGVGVTGAAGGSGRGKG